MGVTTVGGQKFTTFAKNAAWDSDLFEDLVAPKLDNGLLAETWMNGVNPLPSYCTPEYKYDVINIRELSIVLAVSTSRGRKHRTTPSGPSRSRVTGPALAIS